MKIKSLIQGLLPYTACLLLLISGSCKKEQMDKSPFESSKYKVANIPASFKVMSFNVKHHNDADPQSLDQRKGNILQIITTHNPEVVGLQEFSDNWFESWMQNEMANLGYDVYINSTTGTPKAIFYKSNRFSRNDQGHFKLSLTENRYGSWVILTDNQNNQQYFICNSHWTTVSSAERQQFANLIDDVVDDHSQGLPLILFGDFNAQPGTPEINIIKNIKGNNNMVCTHSESGNTFHGWDGNGNSKLDWIFCSRNLAFTDYKVITTSFNGYWPSDHFPIMATITPAIYDGVNYDGAGISGVSSTKYYFADVTGDGREDKIFWRPTFDDGRTRVYGSNGDGTFSFLNSNTNGTSQSVNTSFYFADVTGDGKADKIYWNPTFDSGNTRIYKSNGDGTFSFLNSNGNGASTSSNTTYYFTDVTGDGKADQVVWNPNEDAGHTRVYKSNGDGTFTFLNSNTNGTSQSSNTTFYFADVNGDGRSDKIYWNPTFDSGRTRIYTSNGDGTFNFSSSNTNGASTVATTRFYFADVNGDGKDDKIYWRPNIYMGKPKVYISLGNGNFDDPIYSLRGTSQSEDTQYFFTDISGDGKADQVAWNYNQAPGGNSQGTLRNYFAY